MGFGEREQQSLVIDPLKEFIVLKQKADECNVKIANKDISTLYS